jgi:hypothetical protein
MRFLGYVPTLMAGYTLRVRNRAACDYPGPQGSSRLGWQVRNHGYLHARSRAIHNYPWPWCISTAEWSSAHHRTTSQGIQGVLGPPGVVPFVFLYLIHFWWWEYRLQVIQQWTFPLYFFISLYAVIQYLLCVLLFPEEMADYNSFLYLAESSSNKDQGRMVSRELCDYCDRR